MLLFFFGCSCHKNSNKTNTIDAGLYKKLHESLNLYYVTYDTIYLYEALELLKTNPEYIEHGLTRENYRLVVPLLFNMGKYDKLQQLLEPANFIDDYEKTVNVNMLKYLTSENKDSSVAYLDDTMDMIQKEIKHHPEDSLKLLDYYIINFYKMGLSKTLAEIDSLRKDDPTYSDLFYQDILKENIIEYSKLHPE